MSNIRPHASDLEPGTLVDRDFEIESLVGRGSFSTVYRAVQLSRKRRPVAVKLLHQGIQNELSKDRSGISSNPYLREQMLCQRLKHPAVCRVYKVGTADEGRFYVALEWVEGVTLERHVHEQQGGMPLVEVADVIGQLGSVVAEMHRCQVVHHDLKPSNIMIERSPAALKVKLIDFGIARLAGDESDERAPGSMLVGTPAYMSPEQARGRITDPRSDIFSMAAVAYAMLTGRHHIQLDSRQRGADGYIDYLLSAQPIPTVPARTYRPELPEEIDDILACGLSRTRHARPPTVEMFSDDLEVVLRAHAPTKRRQGLFRRGFGRRKKT